MMMYSTSAYLWLKTLRMVDSRCSAALKTAVTTVKRGHFELLRTGTPPSRFPPDFDPTLVLIWVPLDASARRGPLPEPEIQCNQLNFTLGLIEPSRLSLEGEISLTSILLWLLQRETFELRPSFAQRRN